MPFLTQFQSFFIPTFGEPSVCEELNKFLKSHRIINVEKHLINSDQNTGWAFLIEYSNEEKSSTQNSSSSKIDYREVLTEKQFSIYDKLRQLRKAEAEKTGSPVYTVFTNEQLSQMAINLPTTLQDLKKIKNIGEAKIQQFGEKFIKVIQEISSLENSNNNESEETEIF